MELVRLFLFGFMLLLFASVCIRVYISGYSAVCDSAENEHNTRIQFNIFGKFYGKGHRQPKKEKDNAQEEQTKEQQRAEVEKRRETYESKFTNIRPAKRMSGNQDTEQSAQEVKRNGEKSNRVQQYCADEINMRGKRAAVDREAEIKKARELQRHLEEEEEKYYEADFIAQQEYKAVDREAELKKARELQKQLEEEEEEHFRELMMKSR